MSLVRLLTVGKSLVGAKDQPHRYKLTEQSLLPKFGPLKAAGSGHSALRDPTQRTTGLPLSSASEHVGDGSTDSTNGEEAMNSPNVKRHQSKAFFGWIERWARNPFRAAAPAKAQTVQGELSLDNIKVLRNDLAESDLEVVLKPPPEPESGLEEAVAGAKGPGPMWQKLTARLFGERGQ